MVLGAKICLRPRGKVSLHLLLAAACENFSAADDLACAWVAKVKVKSDETHTTDVMKYDGGKRSKKFRLAAFSLSLTLMTLAAAARMGRFQSMGRG